MAGVLALVRLGQMDGRRFLGAISRYGQVHPLVVLPLGLRRSPLVATLHLLLRLVAGKEMRTVRHYSRWHRVIREKSSLGLR